MNLATNYLGLSLRNPLIVGASPFCHDVAGANLALFKPSLSRWLKSLT